MSKSKECEAKCKCNTAEGRGYSRYYDYPEGCHVKDKVLIASRYGMMAGLVFGTFDVLMYSHAIGFANIIHRYLVHVAPLGLMGATFALVSSKMFQARRKDDELNYFVGGASCSPILASYLKSNHALVAGALVLGAAGVVKKTAVLNNYTFFPEVESHRGMAHSWRRDWTLAEDPKDACKKGQKPADCYGRKCGEPMSVEEAKKKK